MNRNDLGGDTYYDEDDLKDGTGFVPSPVGITEEGSHEWEDVDSASPFADIVSSIGIILSQNSCEEKHQVHSNSKKGQSG